MADQIYKLPNAAGEVRTIRASFHLTIDEIERLATIVAASYSPANHAPDTWGEVVAFSKKGKRRSFHIAGITVGETKEFMESYEDVIRWHLVDDLGFCFASSTPNDIEELDADDYGRAVLPSGPDFSWMDRRRAV